MPNFNKAGEQLIKSFEQFRNKAYMPTKDDRPTIGWGNTYYENGVAVKMGDTITMERANQLFETMLQRTIREVSSLVTSKLNDNQFSALVSFAYNVGPDIDADTIAEGLGDSTLLKLVNKNPNDPTIRIEFMKWNKQKGKVVNGLTNRRLAEAKLYFS